MLRKKNLFPFNFKFRTKYYKVFRQALKYRSTKKINLHHILDLNTHTLVCDVEALTVAPCGLITEHALDQLNKISFHYFQPITCVC